MIGAVADQEPESAVGVAAEIQKTIADQHEPSEGVQSFVEANEVAADFVMRLDFVMRRDFVMRLDFVVRLAVVPVAEGLLDCLLLAGYLVLGIDYSVPLSYTAVRADVKSAMGLVPFLILGYDLDCANETAGNWAEGKVHPQLLDFESVVAYYAGDMATLWVQGFAVGDLAAEPLV